MARIIPGARSYGEPARHSAAPGNLGRGHSQLLKKPRSGGVFLVNKCPLLAVFCCSHYGTLRLMNGGFLSQSGFRIKTILIFAYSGNRPCSGYSSRLRWKVHLIQNFPESRVFANRIIHRRCPQEDHTRRVLPQAFIELLESAFQIVKCEADP